MQPNNKITKQIEGLIANAGQTFIKDFSSNPEYESIFNRSENFPSIIQKDVKDGLEKIQNQIEINFDKEPLSAIIEDIRAFDPFKLHSYLLANESRIAFEFPNFPYGYYCDQAIELENKRNGLLTKDKISCRNQYKKIKQKCKRLKESIIYSLEKELTKKHITNINNRLLELKNELWKKLCEKFNKFILLYNALPDPEFIGNYWDFSEGNWTKNTLSVLTEWKQRYEQDPELKALVAQIGRSKSFSEYKDEILKSVRKMNEKRYEFRYKEEITGVTLGNDLSSMSALELSYLTDPETEILFYKKYIDKCLTNRLYRNTQIEEIIINDEEIKKLENRKTQKGPVILCVDTSGSMQGLPEHIAKLLTFTVIMKSLGEKRPVFLINFSTGAKFEEYLPENYSIEKLCSFLSMAFHGGTDASDALDIALKKSEEERFEDADIMVVSDFFMDELSISLKKRILVAKESGTRLMALIVNYENSSRSIDGFDILWHVNPNNPDRIKLLN